MILFVEHNADAFILIEQQAAPRLAPGEFRLIRWRSTIDCASIGDMSFMGLNRREPSAACSVFSKISMTCRRCSGSMLPGKGKPSILRASRTRVLITTSPSGPLC